MKQYRDLLLPLRQQAQIRNRWLAERYETVLPAVMQRDEIDMWLVACREYNEDPVIMTMLPEPAMSARRRTILAFCKRDDGGVDCLTIDRYGHGDLFEDAWNHEEETQAQALRRVVEERDPAQIGVNISADFAFGDGLSQHEYTYITDAIGDEYVQRLTSAERLCIGWLETRTSSEKAAYSSLVQMGHALIAEAFSSRVIHPGVTTTEDVIWWMRQRMHDLGVQAWFQPSCEIQAQGQHYDDDDKRTLILPGDLLWCDVGFYYLGLATDQQQNAYVLRPNEHEAPAGLREALAQANRLQEIHMDAMHIGRTGNEVLHAALDAMTKAGINGQIYSHPLGYHGHAAGPTIGLWDQQDGVPGKGDYPVYDNTAYSIELNAKYAVPEWDNQEVRISLEEDALLDDGTLRWLDGRQTTLYLIG